MRGQYEELACPFCDKGKIQCWFIPGAWSVKAKRTKTLPGSGSVSRSTDMWLIKSGCSICGKSREEVENELKKKNII